MLQKIKNYFLRRQDRKCIQEAFLLARRCYPRCGLEKRKELCRALQTLLDEYHFNWGIEDGVVKFYYERLKSIDIFYYKGE